MKDQIARDILSNLAVHMKYAKYLPKEERRESWEEIVNRNEQFHSNNISSAVYPSKAIHETVQDKKILPSMRSLQFSGKAIDRNNTRIYNCAYLPVETVEAFRETIYLLLGGTGVGYSVQKHHVDKLPKIKGVKDDVVMYTVEDTIEGWANAVDVLIKSYIKKQPSLAFDYKNIRKKGSPLKVTGGKAPGPAPLRILLENIRNVLDGSVGRKLKPIECHDIQCYLAEGVLAGGIRRSAMISLFSHDDVDMLNAKTGNWWEFNLQRSRANNSVVLLRNKTSRKTFDRIWNAVEASGSGEPGIYWTNNLDWGTNPCAEIALRPYQFCNLVEINGDSVTEKYDWLQRCVSASFLGTMQATYTDFKYLRPIWKETTEEEALIGVGVTGIASNKINKEWIKEGSSIVKQTNYDAARGLGIKPAARCTTIKPSGTSSIVLGTSSGIHPWYSEYYIRRMTINKEEAIYGYLKRAIPQLIEESLSKPETEAYVCIPQKAPEGAVTRSESSQEAFGRVLLWNKYWVRDGHRSGDNTNNVSATIPLKEDDWKEFGDLMWDNRMYYNGISVLPFDAGTYKQTPFEEITKEQYEEMSQYLKNINLSKVKENADYTDLTGELACSGGSCEIT